MGRFDYFHQLSRRDQAVYRRCDAIKTVDLPAWSLPPLRTLAARLQPALRDDKRVVVAKVCNDLVAGICAALEAPLVPVTVKSVRPSNHAGELHGLYTLHEDGRCKVEVWMRTAQQSRVVAYKTFLRTLLHEVCHHLDYSHYELTNSYHCEGFFCRESDLVRKLAAPTEKPEKIAAPKPASAAPAPKKPPQLSFDF